MKHWEFERLNPRTPTVARASPTLSCPKVNRKSYVPHHEPASGTTRIRIRYCITDLTARLSEGLRRRTNEPNVVDRIQRHVQNVLATVRQKLVDQDISQSHDRSDQKKRREEYAAAIDRLKTIIASQASPGRTSLTV